VSTRPSALPAAQAAPIKGRVRAGLLAQAALVAAALTLYLLILIQATGRHQDFTAYLRAASDLWNGRPLYATFLHHPFPDATLRPAFIYPPAFAALIAPLALLPAAIAALLWLLLCQLCLLGSLLLVLRGQRPAPWVLTALVCATFTFYPLWVDAIQGQANLPILLLVTAGILGTLRGRPAWAAAIGMAAAFKLTPLLLIAWLLVERRFREALFLLAGFAVVTAAGAAIRFDDTLTFFTQVMPALARGTAFYGNHSLSGLLARVLSRNPYTEPWFATSLAGLVALLAAMLLFGWWLLRARRDTPLAGAIAFLPLLPLVSTVTWSHHLVILLPVVWLAIISLARRGWPLAETLCLTATTLLLTLVARWPVGPAFGESGFRAAQTMDPLVFLFANGLLIGTLLLFITAPWLLRSR
jgi:alpha-1,2-mannosyltransferase